MSIKPNDETRPKPTVKIATWNILYNPSANDHKKRTIEAAAYLDGADVILLQEVSRDNNYDAARALAEKLDMKVAAEAVTTDYGDGRQHGTAILSRLPIFSGNAIKFSAGSYGEYCTAILESPEGRSLSVASAHLEWGGDRQQTRLAQVAEIDQEMRLRLARIHAATGVLPITVIGGDFNTTPQADPIRFLTGDVVYNETSTLWLDAWDVAGGGKPGYTSLGDNPLSVRTATSVGILDTTLLPKRRIDYLMVHGWAYGKAGCPLDIQVIGENSLTGVYASDHNGLMGDFWDPPLNDKSVSS